VKGWQENGARNGAMAYLQNGTVLALVAGMAVALIVVRRVQTGRARTARAFLGRCRGAEQSSSNASSHEHQSQGEKASSSGQAGQAGAALATARGSRWVWLRREREARWRADPELEFLGGGGAQKDRQTARLTD